MAHQSLAFARGAAGLLVALAACAQPTAAAVAPAADPAAAFLHDLRPLRFHSARFGLSVPFPDGHGWRIDDHRTPLLVATHAATDATVTLGVFGQPVLMNRQRCEDDARARGLVKDADLQTVADEVVALPASFDSHVTVAALPSQTPHRSTAGHIFLFGASLKSCLFVHYETRERPGEDEAALSARLAVARLELVGGIRMDPPLTAPPLTPPP